jgi:hypothetical protein
VCVREREKVESIDKALVSMFSLRSLKLVCLN